MTQNLQHTFNLAILFLLLPLSAFCQDSVRSVRPDSIKTFGALQKVDSTETAGALQKIDSVEISTANSSDSTQVDDELKSEEKNQIKKRRTKKEKLPKSDTARIKITGGPQLYLDYGKLITFPTDFEQKFEIGVVYQFKNRIQPNFHFGIATIEPDAAIENGTYKAEGSYWRVGANYLVPIDNINRLFIGVRYAQSKFDDSGSYEITSELWPTFTESFARTGFEANWFELVLGSEKIFKNGHLLLGGETGIRFINEREKADFIDIYTIPGYGLTSDESSPFLNLYVKYQF
ncbi:MAG: DUF6048 family protein [Fulvivirga sp.]|uniref:DUF6048 family protein n=1 Tax=Fulvivirga sp. TaxID=1931237 RepID=UPI0032EC06E0